MTERRAIVNVAGTLKELPATDTLPGVQVLHGFVFPYQVSLSYDKTNRTVTITPSGATFDVWVQGIRYVKTGAVTSTAHANASGDYFLYYNTSGELEWSTSPWDMKVVSPVCYVYYDTVPADGIALFELHTYKRNPEWHESQHFAIGTFVRSGLEVSGYTLNGDGNTAVTFQVAAGTIVDEDIEFAISTLADNGPYTIVRRTGASGYTWDSANTVPYLAGATWIQYNQRVTGSWQMTEAGAQTRWVNYFLSATTAIDTAKRIFLIPGQTLHTSLSSAQSESNASLDLTGLGLSEFVCVWKLTFATGSGYTATGRARLVEVNRITNTRGALSVSLTTTTHNLLTGRDVADTHPASSITNTPAGTIAATTVQAAIDELDSEKIATSAIGVTVQAYDADIPTVSASQAEMEAGTETALRSMSPLRIKQAIDALGGSSEGGGYSNLKVVLATEAWTPPVTGAYRVHVIGAGGSGAALRGSKNDLPALNQTVRQWYGMTVLGSDVYACVYGGDIYKQTGGTGDFVSLGQTSRNWRDMTTLGSDVYACVQNGDIYKQTGGTGDFVALAQTSRAWVGMTTLGSDVYACVYGGDIYKQTGGTGNFVALGQTAKNWSSIAVLGTDIYAVATNQDIYKQTGGTGNFVALNQGSKEWRVIVALGSDVYAMNTNGGDIWKQTGGTGDFVPLSNTGRNWGGATSLGSDLYVSVISGDIYKGVPTMASPIGATGGGAGGYARKTLTLSSSVEYTLTVGAGGSVVSSTENGVGANGNAGGDSSIVGSDIDTITGGGGGGGGYTLSADTFAGALGGTASGGDVNYTGGGSGSVTGMGQKATGGGAVAIFGIAYPSGNATSSNPLYLARTGGAGVGGKSGDAVSNTSSSNTFGGGSGGPSSDKTDSSTTNNNATTDQAAMAAYAPPPFMLSNGYVGIISSSPLPTGPGVGGTSGASAGTRGGHYAGAAGGFSSQSALAGGGGSIVSYGSTVTSGAGGDGIILIEW